ncbi:MAG: recombinase family protein, partial [Anaerolineales bacterium]|nr:recombinase family protein [Anaerolineales bacterium]
MRIAVYVRVSTQHQAQTQTIEQQLERLRAHLQSQGWDLLEENTFRDDGYSGASLNRPGLDQLRDKVKAADIDRVVLTAPDRLARNYVHQMLLLEEWEQQGCEVEFLDRPMSHDPHDQLLLQIRGAVAEYERTLIAERMRRGRQRKLQAGVMLPWTQAPYGYRVDPERPRDPAGVRVEQAEAAVVKEMFAWYAQDATSLFGLAKHLQAQGHPSPHGKAYWNQATIRGILGNPVYTGQVCIGRKQPYAPTGSRSPLHRKGQTQSATKPAPRENWQAVTTVPALVTAEQYDQVQAKLAQNQKYARRHNTAHWYLLRGMVSCGLCELSCMGRALPSNYRYYICRGHADPIQSCRDERCQSRYIPAGQLDEFVWCDLCEVLQHPEMIRHALERAHAGHWLPQELQARRDHLRQSRLALEHQIDRLSDAYLQGVIALAEYQRRRRELDQKLQGLDALDKQLEVNVDRQAELAAVATSAEAFCQRVQAGLADATFERKRQLIELLIDRVVVTNDEVEIRYVIPTSPASEHVRFCHLRLDHFNRLASVVVGEPSSQLGRRPIAHQGGVFEVAANLEALDRQAQGIGTAIQAVLADQHHFGVVANGLPGCASGQLRSQDRGRTPVGRFGVWPIA